MKERKRGSLWSGIMFIGSSCLGVGMLALPVQTGFCGFMPSLVLFFMAWLFMTVSALYIVDVQHRFQKEVHFISMIEEKLGRKAMQACWFIYLFLFYSLLVAYIAASGQHVQSWAQVYGGFAIPGWVGSLFFVLFFGWIIYLGTKRVDQLNQFLMMAKMGAFAVIIFLGLPMIEEKYLSHVDWSYAFFPFPLLVIAFGFHNMIPTIYTYMGGNVRKVKGAILGGSLFVFFVYVIWQMMALGVIPLGGDFGIKESYLQGHDAATAISYLMGSSEMVFFAQMLAFFAILTCFLAQAMTVVHFLADGLRVAGREKGPVFVCALALAPPLMVTLINPTIFFAALNFAGGVCALLLFGLFPAWMVLKEKGVKNFYSHAWVTRAMIMITLLLASYQLLASLGISLAPTPGR